MGKKKRFMREGVGGEGVKGHSIAFMEMMNALVLQTKHFCYSNTCTIRKKLSKDFKDLWSMLRELTAVGCSDTKMERNSNGSFFIQKSASFYLTPTPALVHDQLYRNALVLVGILRTNLQLPGPL